MKYLMLFTKRPRLKIALVAVTVTLAFAILGFKTEMPIKEKALKYGSAEIGNQLERECGSLGVRANITGSIIFVGEREAHLRYKFSIGNEIISEYGVFVFPSVKFYGLTFPMVDIAGATRLNCAKIRILLNTG